SSAESRQIDSCYTSEIVRGRLLTREHTRLARTILTGQRLRKVGLPRKTQFCGRLQIRRLIFRAVLFTTARIAPCITSVQTNVRFDHSTSSYVVARVRFSSVAGLLASLISLVFRAQLRKSMFESSVR